MIHLEVEALPRETSCSGMVITFPDGEKAEIIAETDTQRAMLGDKA